MGFPKDRIQNFPIPPNAPGWDGALNCNLDEVPVEISSTPLPLRGVRILSPDSVKPGMQDANCQPNCTLLQEYGVPFSRVRLIVNQIRSPLPNIIIPTINLQITFAVACIGSPNWSGVFSPKSLNYSDWLLQASGLLATELEIFANIDPILNPGANQLYLTMSVVVDRHDNDTWHVVNGPDVT